MTKIFVGDVGTIITLDCGQDISEAMAHDIIARKPDGTKVVWSAELNGTNMITYVVGVGDLDIPGTWHLQASIAIPGWSGSGEIVSLEINRVV